ncbi:RNA-directed DNA polymerase [Candidatus Binatus sp.]|uniref:RNA-directed DNA polymerase n=1 Tax=Candidatus Binatus sp. TaxID=2811406 RepID=UPI003C4BE538
MALQTDPADFFSLFTSDGTPDFSYQLSSDPFKPNWLKSRFECWRSFRDESLKSLPPEVTHVVFADVAGFYENIDIPTLISDLKSTGADSSAIDQLSACLNRWAHIRSRSIPQGHSAADILAKLYLHPVDVTLRDLGYRHLRFVDDFRIFCRSRVEAIRALTDLTRQLRLRGLVLNSVKSQILIANQARRKIDGTIPIIEGVRQSFVKNITELIGAEYVTSAEAQSVLGKSAEEIPLSIIQSTLEAYFLEGRDDIFRATLFHFLIHRLGAAKSQFALKYCLELLGRHPEDTEDILRYVREVASLSEVSDSLASYLESDAVYVYQIYQIMEWVGDLQQRPSDRLLAIARKLSFDVATDPSLRSTSIRVIADWGTNTDLLRLESSYSHARGSLEQSEIVCALRRLEASRRNEFFGRVQNDNELNLRAVKWAKRAHS